MYMYACMSVFCIRVSHLFASVHVCMYICEWRIKGDIHCLPQSLSLLNVESGLVLNLNFIFPTVKSFRLACSRDFLSLSPLDWNYRWAAIACQLLHGF